MKDVLLIAVVGVALYAVYQIVQSQASTTAATNAAAQQATSDSQSYTNDGIDALNDLAGLFS
jgi:hypothetical protein